MIDVLYSLLDYKDVRDKLESMWGIYILIIWLHLIFHCNFSLSIILINLLKWIVWEVKWCHKNATLYINLAPHQNVQILFQ